MAYRRVKEDVWNPLLRPEWRFERVLGMLERDPPGRCTKHDDGYVRTARRFLAAFRDKDDPAKRFRLKYEEPGMWYATLLYNAEGVDLAMKFMLEARLLAGQAYDKIAYNLNTQVEVVDWYERVFFNVARRLGKHDWIIGRVILPASQRLSLDPEDTPGDNHHRFVSPPVVVAHLDFTCKFLCYFGKDLVCEPMFSGFTPGFPLRSLDDLDDWLDECQMRIIRRKSTQTALSFNVSKYDVMELFATHARIVEISKSQIGQEQKQTLIEQHVHTMMTELPWVVGAEAEEIFSGTIIGDYDKMGAELRDDELLLVAAGQKGPEGLPDINFPTSHKETRDANA